MKIGLVRHFEVVGGMPRKWLTNAELHHWRTHYEQADIISKPVDLGGIQWSQCISSTSKRAVLTARHIYPGQLTHLDELREPDINPFTTGRIKLPFPGWQWVTIMAWITSHSSQSAVKRKFLNNIDCVIRAYVANRSDDLLIVSHAGVMMFLRKELLRLGYNGPKFRTADHGRLYIFEKP